VINPTQPAAFLQAQQETVARGAQPLLAGGEATVAGKQGFYIKPSLFRTQPELNVNPVEVFHTYATICPVSTPEEALRLANSSPYGFGFERVDQGHRARRGNGQAVPRRHRANQLPHSIAYGLPYGGQGISGGPGGGVNCEETFSRLHAVKAVYVAEYPG
jgi:acyl-CoA reductase-like NAD-dependent aldehyde dehydrogenase